MSYRSKRALQRNLAQVSGYAPDFSGKVGDLLREGQDFHAQGRLDDAERCFKEAMGRERSNFDVLHLYASLLLNKGEGERALPMIQEAISLKPDFALGWCNMGEAFIATEKPQKAVDSFKMALDLDPRLVDAWSNLGYCQRSLGQLDQAVESYRRAGSLAPENAEVFASLGECFFQMRDLDEAMGAAQRAIHADPKNAVAYNTYGLTLKAMGQTKEAAIAFRASIKNDPRYAIAYANLGLAYLEMSQPAQALEACIQAVQLQERLPVAMSARATALRLLGHLDEALVACRQAIQDDPNLAEAHNGLGAAYLDISRHAEAIQSFRKAIQLDPGYRKAHSNLLMAMQYSADVDPAEIKAEAEVWAAAYAPDNYPAPAARPIKRIGFVSGDLLAHPIASFIEGLFGGLKARGFQIYCYANQGHRDATSERLAAHVVSWRTIIGFDDAAVAQIVKEDEIDLLVDLSGHRFGNRLGVFGRRPCARQITMLGYAGTTGMPQFDGILGDHNVTPEAEDALYTESVLRLQSCWLNWTPPDIDAELRRPPCESGSPFTFGVFNQSRKITRNAVTLWASILHDVPESQILIKSATLASGALRHQYTTWFQEQGVDPDRVIFLAHTSRQAHFMAINQVDLCLDSFPYGGATAALEGLWMGVPSVTLSGKGFVHKMSSTLMAQAGLAEYACHTVEEYAKRAVETARNPSSLFESRISNRDRLLSSPVCDTSKYTEDFLAAVAALDRKAAD